MGNPERIRLGMLQSPKGRRWVTLLSSPLTVEVNQQLVPLTELLFADFDEVALDEVRIQHLLTIKAERQIKQYSSNTARREARKSKTQAMYQDWRDAHALLLQEHPGKNKSWYARKISRMDVAHGREYETIRKRLY